MYALLLKLDAFFASTNKQNNSDGRKHIFEGYFSYFYGDEILGSGFEQPFDAQPNFNKMMIL